MYTGGQRVSHNGRSWRAQWWTQNETPGVASVWVDLGPCSGGSASPSASPSPSRSTSPSPSVSPSASPSPSTSPSASPSTSPGAYPAWAPNTYYAAGVRVTYGGRTWQCRQNHTSLVGWEPPNVGALWLAV
ncbi:carbohydrate-binding protein [Catellatospora bangladeshensis]|uniref:carbohydrate-binding protein n=1 Tax=Catellatospora bangladeshensis TaxID=310355 RepID=UPI0036083F53